MFRQATNIFNLEENVVAVDKSHPFLSCFTENVRERKREKMDTQSNTLYTITAHKLKKCPDGA